jgi:hypothetical protein
MKTNYGGGFISVAPFSPRRKAVSAKTGQLKSWIHTRLHCAYFGTQAVLIGKRLLVVAGEVELGFDWGRKKKRMQSWQTRDFVATLGNRNKCKHQVNRFGFWDRKDQLGSNILDVPKTLL